MENLNRFYIDGAWVAPQSEQVFPVMNPATEQQVGEVILGNTEDVNRAVAAAKKAFVTFSRTTQAERLVLLEQLLKATQDRLDDLAHACWLAARVSPMGSKQVGMQSQPFSQM